jgi:hypothetical protein
MRELIFSTAAVCFLVLMAIEETVKQPTTYSGSQQFVTVNK